MTALSIKPSSDRTSLIPLAARGSSLNLQYRPRAESDLVRSCAKADNTTLGTHLVPVVSDTLHPPAIQAISRHSAGLQKEKLMREEFNIAAARYHRAMAALLELDIDNSAADVAADHVAEARDALYVARCFNQHDLFDKLATFARFERDHLETVHIAFIDAIARDIHELGLTRGGVA